MIICLARKTGQENRKFRKSTLFSSKSVSISASRDDKENWEEKLGKKLDEVLCYWVCRRPFRSEQSWNVLPSSKTPILEKSPNKVLFDITSDGAAPTSILSVFQTIIGIFKVILRREKTWKTGHFCSFPSSATATSEFLQFAAETGKANSVWARDFSQGKHFTCRHFCSFSLFFRLLSPLRLNEMKRIWQATEKAFFPPRCNRKGSLLNDKKCIKTCVTLN